jgi:hypothetical protein
MSSLRRINASRANGARSRGPVTPEGKQRSAANAVRHGLLARAVVLQHESAPAFRALLDDFIACHHPRNSVELGYVEEMVVCQWRIRRCWAIETALIDRAAADNPAGGPLPAIASAYASPASAPGLDLVNRYETRNHRMYQRALNNLLRERQSPPPDDFPNLPNEPNPENEHSPAGFPESKEHSEEPAEAPPAALPEPDPAPEPAPATSPAAPAPPAAHPPTRDPVQARISDVLGSFAPLLNLDR